MHVPLQREGKLVFNGPGISFCVDWGREKTRKLEQERCTLYTGRASHNTMRTCLSFGVLPPAEEGALPLGRGGLSGDTAVECSRNQANN